MLFQSLSFVPAGLMLMFSRCFSYGLARANPSIARDVILSCFTALVGSSNHAVRISPSLLSLYLSLYVLVSTREYSLDE